jgi:hypothetical protein
MQNRFISKVGLTILCLAFLVSCLPAAAQNQTMNFPSGPSWTGFTFSGWITGSASGTISPNMPNVNAYQTIAVNSGTWEVVSFQTAASSFNNPPGQGTWEVYDDNGDTKTFTISAQTITLNWSGIHTLTFHLTNNGPGGSNPNQTYDLGSVVYNVPNTGGTPASTPGVTPASSTVCPGTATNLNISGSLNSASDWAIYTGSCGGTLVGTTTGPTFPVIPSATTTYYVRGEGASVAAGSCGTATVQTYTLPTGSISGSTNTCNGTQVDLSISLTGTSPWNVTYSDGSSTHNITGITSSPYSLPVTPSSTTTYTLTAASDAHCSAVSGGLSGSATVTVYNHPTAALSGGASYCNGQSTATNLSLAVTGSGTINGTLSDGTPFSGTAPTITVPVSPTSTTTYTVSTLNDAHCTANPGNLSGSATVTVYPRPTAAISGGAIYCNGQSTTTDLSLAVTGSGTISGTLSDGTDFTGIAPTINVSVSPTMTTTYTVSTLNDSHCIAQAGDISGSATVTVNPRPTASLSGGANYCNGQTTTTNLSLSVTGSGTISGTLSDGTEFSGTAPTINVSVSPSSTTTYSISTLSDANCTAQAGDLSGTATVSVNPRPSAALSGGAVYCNGQTTTTGLSLEVTGSGTLSGTLSDGTPFSGTAPTIIATVNPSSTTTYTIATLTDGNCSALAGDLSGTATVTVNARPTAAISGGANYCNGQSTKTNLTLTVTGSGTISGTLSDGTQFSGTAPTINVSVSPSSTTTYTVSTLSDANCTAQASDLSGSATVNVNARPTAVLSGGAVYCNGQTTTTGLSLTVTGSGAVSGTLSDGTPFSGTAPTITVDVTPTSTTTYTVATLIDGNCTAQAGDLSGMATVTVNPRPTASISGSAIYCSGQSTTTNLTLTVTGSGTISGTLSDETAFSGTAPTIIVSVSPASTTTYTVASLSDANCTSQASDLSGSATVTVNPLPSATISGTTAICQNSLDPTITFNGSLGSGSYMFAYSLTDGTNTSTGTVGGSPSGTLMAPTTTGGTYTYTLTGVTDNTTTCSQPVSNQTAVITVNPLPNASIITASMVTAVSTGNIASVANAGTGAVYSWSITNGSIQGSTTSSSISYTAGITGDVGLQVSVTSGVSLGSGCGPVPGSIQVPITAQPCPNPKITLPWEVCSGSTGNLASVANDGSGAKYAWTISDGNITAGSGTDQITYTANPNTFADFLPSNFVWISVKVTNSSGVCSVSSGSYPVFIDPLPIAAIATAPSVCASSSGNIAFVPNAGPGAKYTWTITGGTIGSGSGTSLITYTAGASGSVTLAVSVSNALGCVAASGNKLVSIVAYPATSITTSASVCSGSKGNPASVASAGTGAVYAWSISGGVINSGINSSSISYTAGASGSVTLSVKVTNSTGCSAASGNKSISISSAPKASITAASPVCSSSTGNTASVAIGASSYAWTITNGIITKGAGTSSITYTAGASGTIALGITVTNSTGCKASSSGAIAISPKLVPSFIQIAAVCQSSTAAALPLKSLNGITGSWNPSKISTSATGTVSYLFTPAAGQCATTATMKITIQKCSKASAADLEDSKTITTEETTDSKMVVSVWPSPTLSSFSLIVSGKRTEVAEIRIYDITGRVLDHKRTATGEIVRFGGTYTTGMYIVEVLQGPERKVIKVIKD